MGAINFGINRNLVEVLQKNHSIKNFVETGTYLGGTSFWASQIFEQVHTIEISEEIYKSTSSKYKDVSNIFFYLGDSKNVLPLFIDKLKGRTLFWLDGHWCGRNTGGKHNECPIFDELKQAIKLENCVIIIDDIRYFLGPNPNDHGENYPTLDSILKFIGKELPNHYTTIHDDTLICAPADCKPDIDKDWIDNYSKRFPQSFKSVFSKILWRIRNLDFTLEKNRK